MLRNPVWDDAGCSLVPIKSAPGLLAWLTRLILLPASL